MSYVIYKFLSSLLYAIGFPIFYIYSQLTGEHRDSLAERRGIYHHLVDEKRNGQRIWLHAASVGEVRAAQALLPELQQRFPGARFFLSTMTRHGQQVAKEQAPSSVTCFYAPLDVCRLVRRALTAIRPACYICLETELWPNLLTEARRAGVDLYLLNGRLSERSARRYAKLAGLITPLVQGFTAIAAISDHDKDRYIRLGARPERVITAGNAKYDSHGQANGKPVAALRDRLTLHEDQRVIIFGSTHSGEEDFFIKAYTALQSFLPDTVFLLAPRHLNRLPEIENLFLARGLSYEKLSELSGNTRRSSIILIDTMGELATLYSIGSFIFCGGSMVPKGGHNIMEAARWGKPVYYGPHMKDFADAAELLEAHAAAIPITQAEDFIQSVRFLAANPQHYASICANARLVAASQQGAASRQARIIRERASLRAT